MERTPENEPKRETSFLVRFKQALQAREAYFQKRRAPEQRPDALRFQAESQTLTESVWRCRSTPNCYIVTPLRVWFTPTR